MKITWKGVDRLQKKLIQKSATDFRAVEEKNIRDIYTRSQKAGGTPVGDYTGGGQLRKSAQYRSDEMGYLAEYGPHVEYGHRTINGGYVPGQYYLKRNVDTQRPIYKQDLKDKLKE
ncbi:hypothetical protein CWR48_15710 [Oceanobacillus arenosus]|uniref:HK97 gp10 family phage protein n=1 Tax=Oceanobacillus arenosus TaxID=1229153 RepID=A0A3D8PLP9_9BACI|nr:HK97 gp10 family phage protein [Oceanobacillus arenosus]RDW17046.1 hypothetical protein CWR48_15710 [Oceanobacillus arenosus]